MSNSQEDRGSAGNHADAVQPLVFDKAGMMARIGDDEDLARMVADSFLEHVPGQVAALRGSLVAGDLLGAGQMAHKVRGAAAAVGGEAFCAVALQLEMTAKTGDAAAASALLNDVELQLDHLQKALAVGL